MPRPKKQRLKQRADGRYCCKYHGIQFMGATEDEALAARAEYKRQEEAGELAMQYGLTVAEYAEKWLPRAKVHVSDQTYAESAALLEKLTTAIGGKRFADVRPSDIKDIYSTAFRGLSDSYIKAGAQLYRALFSAAVEDGLCKVNPALSASAKPHKGRVQTKTRAITDQERRWIETLCTGHRAHAAVMAMLYAGIRPQEAKALDLDRDVNFDANVITVQESVHMDGSNRYKATDTLKTAYSGRKIPLFPPLREALLRRHEREAVTAWEKDAKRCRRLHKPEPPRPDLKAPKKKGALIRAADGGAVTVQSWRSLWESYVTEMETAINGCSARWYGKRNEDQGKELPPFQRFTVLPYDLRHSFCTMCRDNGVEINTCVHWMGHKDAKMILKIYDEYTEDRSKKEAEKLNQKLFGMQNGMQPETEHQKPVEK